MRLSIPTLTILFCFAVQGQQQSIYYDNLEGIEFRVLESGVKLLTITFFEEGRIIKLNFAKKGQDEFEFITVREDGIGKQIKLSEVSSLMPRLIKKMNKRHPETSVQEIERIIKMIY